MLTQEHKAYLQAKSTLAKLENLRDEKEKEYIMENGIANMDGSIPDHIWQIDDEDSFNHHYTTFGKRFQQSDLYQMTMAARVMLREAEFALIALKISVAPDEIQELLVMSCMCNPVSREQMIEYALDVESFDTCDPKRFAQMIAATALAIHGEM